MSKLETKIASLLYKNGVVFKREFSFSDLKGCKNVPLRFDFAVYRNNQLFCLIEGDGKQHFQFTPYFHKNILGFHRSLEWDRKKNKYCLLRNIPLLRIPYWDYDILTFNRIFTEPTYRVKNKYHIDNLRKELIK